MVDKEKKIGNLERNRERRGKRRRESSGISTEDLPDTILSKLTIRYAMWNRTWR